MSRKDKAPTYQDRNELLKTMNPPYSNYQEYLASDLWKSIKSKVRLGVKCKICKIRYATVHHHLDYQLSTLLGDDLSKIVPLCHYCHHLVEFTYQDKKRSLYGAQKEYLILTKQITRSSRAKGYKAQKKFKKPKLKCNICNFHLAKKKKTYCGPCKAEALRRGHGKRITPKCTICNISQPREGQLLCRPCRKYLDIFKNAEQDIIAMIDRKIS